MAFSWSSIRRSKPLRLSSAKSNWLLQYSRLLSSSCCSFLRTSSMLSTILMTLSKVPRPSERFPDNIIMSRSRPAFWPFGAAASALWRMSKAPAREPIEAAALICARLAPALGMVFLNRSRASSSLSTLIVSASATSSSALTFERSSHSAVLVSQLCDSSCKNFWSAMRAASVSVKSSFICTILTPSSPICLVLDSIEALNASTSLVFAVIISS
mmetsp:Transcript_36686/g.73009  ORF Transcript_36686/g.73009 Transcript_36686/m.73009 type:complete len:214 (-) Transcript_36686:109-750(-)